MRVHLDEEQNIVFEEANAVETATGTEHDAFLIINGSNVEDEPLYGAKNRPERWVTYVNKPSGKGG